MAKSGRQQTIAAGSGLNTGWTDLYVSTSKSTSGIGDGGDVSGVQITCVSGAVEVQVDNIHGVNSVSTDSDQIYAIDNPNTVQYSGKGTREAPIRHVRVRGLNGVAALITWRINGA